MQGVTPAAATGPAPTRDEFAAIRKQLVIRELQAAAADLVMLQEVVHDDARSLADALGSRAVQAVVNNKSRQRAVLVDRRWQVAGASVIELPCANASQERPRFAMVCDVVSPSSERVRLVNVHLSLDGPSRARSAASLLALHDQPVHAVVIAGDFNEDPGAFVGSTLHAAGWRDAWAVREDEGYTAYHPERSTRVDRIHYFGEIAATNASVIGSEPDRHGFYPSDHAGVVADFVDGTLMA